MSNQLTINNLTLFRGEKYLFKGISFVLSSGDLILITGPNGSGKTTMLRAIAGLLEPEVGKVSWNQKSISNNRQTYHENISFIAHTHGLKGSLSIIENLKFEANLHNYRLDNIEDALERLSLQLIKNIPFKHLSAGQKRRASLARLMLNDSALWLLDEPTSNLDTDAHDIFKELLNEHILNKGLCVLATHHPDAFDGSKSVIELT